MNSFFYAHCSLLTAHCSLLTAHCSFINLHNFFRISLFSIILVFVNQSVMFKIILLPVLAVAIATNSYAQKPFATFNHVALMVTDANKSADFYSSLLQLKPLKNPFPGSSIRWLSLGGNMQLHLNQGSKAEVTVSKDNHIAFSVASITDFIKLLNSRHIPYDDGGGHPGKMANRPDGVQQIYFHDPDGYRVEVNNAQ